jgi:hypothetical protein
LICLSDPEAALAPAVLAVPAELDEHALAASTAGSTAAVLAIAKSLRLEERHAVIRTGSSY